jgi:hypothetical protein
MAHLKEKIAELVFGELPGEEMTEARLHLEGCGDCRNEVEAFQRTQAFLRVSRDSDPPRQIIFESEKNSSVRRWLIPVGAAAAVLLAVLVALPIHLQWRDSQLIIAFGAIPETAAPVPGPAVVVREPIVQPVDYERIIAAVRAQQEGWLRDELQARDAANTRQVQRLSGDIAYLESMQRVMYRETLDNASTIQLLAQSQPQE